MPEVRAQLRQFNSEGDQVQVLAHCPPKIQLSKHVNVLMGASARPLGKECGSHVRRYLRGGNLLVRVLLRRTLLRRATTDLEVGT
ncbi:transposase [Streptomyces sp. NPDC016734]|uniref:transposase n=1 Tax=Streptomyces TaxID=1883 RepID=UPI000A92840E